MITEHQINNDIKDLQAFLKTQSKKMIEYKNEITNSISGIEDIATKTRLSAMFNEALKGNIENVQSLVNTLTDDLKQKNER